MFLLRQWNDGGQRMAISHFYCFQLLIAPHFLLQHFSFLLVVLRKPLLCLFAKKRQKEENKNINNQLAATNWLQLIKIVAGRPKNPSLIFRFRAASSLPTSPKNVIIAVKFIARSLIIRRLLDFVDSLISFPAYLCNDSNCQIIRKLTQRRAGEGKISGLKKCLGLFDYLMDRIARWRGEKVV